MRKAKVCKCGAPITGRRKKWCSDACLIAGQEWKGRTDAQRAMNAANQRAIYAALTPEQRTAKNRAAKRDPAQKRVNARRWRAAHPERHKANNDRYRQKHIERIREHDRVRNRVRPRQYSTVRRLTSAEWLRIAAFAESKLKSKLKKKGPRK